MKHIKRIFSYAVHFKWMLCFACILMMSAIVIDLIPTKITQQILDNYISGIYNPWVMVDQDGDNVVEINDNYIIQPSYHELRNLQVIDDVAIVEINRHFYMVKGVPHVSEGTRSFDENTNTILVNFDGKESVYHDVYQLSSKEVISLYEPYYGDVVKLLVILGCMYLMSCVIWYMNNYMYGKVSIE